MANHHYDDDSRPKKHADSGRMNPVAGILIAIVALIVGIAFLNT